MSDAVESRVKRIMADILGTDAASINDAARIGKMAQWDSANHITLILALEQEFGVSFDVTAIEAMTNFREIVSALRGKI